MQINFNNFIGWVTEIDAITITSILTITILLANNIWIITLISSNPKV